jgi:hypothetical protein
VRSREVNYVINRDAIRVFGLYFSKIREFDSKSRFRPSDPGHAAGNHFGNVAGVDSVSVVSDVGAVAEGQIAAARSARLVLVTVGFTVIMNRKPRVVEEDQEGLAPRRGKGGSRGEAR